MRWKHSSNRIWKSHRNLAVESDWFRFSSEYVMKITDSRRNELTELALLTTSTTGSTLSASHHSSEFCEKVSRLWRKCCGKYPAMGIGNFTETKVWCWIQNFFGNTANQRIQDPDFKTNSFSWTNEQRNPPGKEYLSRWLAIVRRLSHEIPWSKGSYEFLREILWDWDPPEEKP